jgi:hypothetical protein
MKIRVTPEDFLKGGLAELGWLPAQITKWDESGVAGPNAKNPGSQFTKVEFTVTVGGSKGKIVYANFSEVAGVFVVPLIEAISGQKVDKAAILEMDVRKESMEGKLVDIHTIASSYNGKPGRQIDLFRPYTGPAMSAEVAQAGV